MQNDLHFGFFYAVPELGRRWKKSEMRSCQRMQGAVAQEAEK